MDLVLCAAIGCAVGLGIGSVQNKDISVSNGTALTPNGNGGLIVTPENTGTVKLTATPLSATADGIAAYAETGYTLTATITPDSATNKQVD